MADLIYKSCLLVDDDKDDQQLFEEAIMFINESVKIFTDDDIDQALTVLRRLKPLPDVIFLDQNMPRTTGLNGLKKIKAISQFAHIPVYMYSTSMSKVDLEQARLSGAKDYITKPTSFTDLIKILEGVFHRG